MKLHKVKHPENHQYVSSIKVSNGETYLHTKEGGEFPKVMPLMCLFLLVFSNIILFSILSPPLAIGFRKFEIRHTQSQAQHIL